MQRTGIERAFSGLSVIRMRRRDRIAQAVSRFAARQTWQWTSRQQAKKVSLTYDFETPRWHLDAIQEAESALDLALSVLSYPTVSVEYETLYQDVPGTIDGVRSKLGLPKLEKKPTARIDRQESSVKTEMTERLRSELENHWDVGNGNR